MRFDAGGGWGYPWRQSINWEGQLESLFCSVVKKKDSKGLVTGHENAPKRRAGRQNEGNSLTVKTGKKGTQNLFRTGEGKEGGTSGVERVGRGVGTFSVEDGSILSGRRSMTALVARESRTTDTIGHSTLRQEGVGYPYSGLGGRQKVRATGVLEGGVN